MKITKKFIKEIVETLERVIIILEDNLKIKDVQGFYNSGDLVFEVNEIRKELEK